MLLNVNDRIFIDNLDEEYKTRVADIHAKYISVENSKVLSPIFSQM
jgi:hypothetical protein